MGNSTCPRSNEMIEDQVLLNRFEKEFTHSDGFVSVGVELLNLLNLSARERP